MTSRRLASCLAGAVSLTSSLAGGARAEEWTLLPVPGVWESDARFALHDGFAWYRTFVRVPDAWRGKALQLRVERVDNAQETFWNGVKLGAAGSMPPRYSNGVEARGSYAVPAEQIRNGTVNTVAIRVYDAGGRGGFKGAAPALVEGDTAITLDGAWQFRTGDDAAWAAASTPAEGVHVFDLVVEARKPSITPAPPAASPPLERKGPLSPREAWQALKTPDDLTVDLVLAEPLVRQPVALSFDERGRLWVVQYIQYPHPAGLKMLSRDGFWRAVYDKVPPPPPHQFPGADKVTIHEDTDGDGVFDKQTTFVEGLNIATSVARGRGGVWVMNPPYLLFYPDRDNDDVPDGDPEVRLEGFGLEDTHSVANSLTWGPDGWLYAAQGSTVTGAVRRPGIDKDPVRTMGQLIWRYQPDTRRYEVFAEGGGNAFGVEIDSRGRVFSGHNGGDTRGFHYVQGGYYLKGFGKHGPLSNPFAFGYFPAMRHPSVDRFTHTFVIYEGGALPEEYAGRLFGVAPLLAHVVWSAVEPDGTTVKTHDLGKAIESSDPWFRPVDIKHGPDGALYIADWYDGQVNHFRNHEGQIDPSNGRVYRLRAKGAPPTLPFNLSQRTSLELVRLLSSSNRWIRQTALRLLGDRKDESLIPTLSDLVVREKGQLALEALWALHQSGGLGENEMLRAFEHINPDVRAWAVRLAGDESRTPERVAARLATLAESESSAVVRSQLASTARRLPPGQCLPVVKALFDHDDDTYDPHIPLLLWWAIEAKITSDPQAVLTFFEDRAVWGRRLVADHIVHRLCRRFAASGARADLLVCVRLFDLAPDPESARRLVRGFEEAFAGRSLTGLPDELARVLERSGIASPLLELRRHKPEAIEQAIRLVLDETADRERRRLTLQTLGEIREAKAVPAMLELLRTAGDEALRVSALEALAPHDDPAIANAALEAFSQFSTGARETALGILSTRASWARSLLEWVDSGRVDKASIPPETARRLARLKDDRVRSLVAKHWGELATPAADRETSIARLTGSIESGPGDPYAGKKLFAASCGKCHKLFGDGGEVGPDLTPYQRSNLANLLLSVVSPSAEIREGFEAVSAVTKDRRVLTGFLADKDAQGIVLRDVDGQTTALSHEEIDELGPLGQSLMPDGLLDGLGAQQVRDLFAYLRSSQPLNN